MPKRGKKITELRSKVSRDAALPAAEGIALAKSLCFAKFDESVDVAVRLNVDPRHADQNVRGSCMLPHGTGKSVRVAKGEKAQEARDAGADVVGDEDLVAKIQDEGFLEFDKAIATPDMMRFVGRIGRILGPRGLMPNPKIGTVTFDVAQAVQASKGGKVDFRVDKGGIVHTTIGRKHFDVDKLKDNFDALIQTLVRLKPASAKGNYVRSITVSTTMGAGVRLDPNSIN